MKNNFSMRSRAAAGEILTGIEDDTDAPQE
jgi:hypothetical protein